MSDAERVAREKQKDREAQLERAAHQRALKQAEKQGNVDLLREALKTHLDAGTVTMLDNYLSPDFLLSKANQATLTELRWILIIRVRQVFDAHPPPGSKMTGERARDYLGEGYGLEPLTTQDRMLIKSYARGLYFRALRSEGGFQWDKLGETTTRMERVDGNGNESSWRDRARGLF